MTFDVHHFRTMAFVSQIEFDKRMFGIGTRASENTVTDNIEWNNKLFC